MVDTTSGGLLPAEFLSFVRTTAMMGFFAAGAMIIGLAYKGYKKVLGEEQAKKYRLYFVLATFPFVLLYIFMFLVIFTGVKLKFWEPEITINEVY